MFSLINSLNNLVWEWEVILWYPVISYVLPVLSYLEALSPILDAFEIDAQITLILFSLAFSLALLNTLLQKLLSKFVANNFGAVTNTVTHTEAVVTSSRLPLFKKLLKKSDFFKN